METRVALISVILKDAAAAEQLNAILHAYREYIIGRMGIPYKPKNLHIISIALDAPRDVINAVSGRLGRIPGISSKAVYADE